MYLTNYVGNVAKFLLKHGRPVRIYPELPPAQEMEYNANLFKEECIELTNAMYEKDLIGVADELADVLYMVFAIALSYGIPIESIFDEVHRSNMTKPVEHKGEFKKINKGSKPQIAAIIQNQLEIAKHRDALNRRENV